jgi:hypothetical protein
METDVGAEPFPPPWFSWLLLATHLIDGTLTSNFPPETEYLNHYMALTMLRIPGKVAPVISFIFTVTSVVDRPSSQFLALPFIPSSLLTESRKH